MRKKIVIPGLIALAIAIIFGALQTESEESVIEEETTKEIIPTVTMPTKSSRPGCEETNDCYIPSQISIKAGESVTWLNEDVAFHSVTSGTYDNPNGMFDSGHLDPDESFTVKFDESGTFDYHCTLHPWMEAKVVVN